MGSSNSSQRDSEAASANIGHFDHNYDAILVKASPGMVPEPANDAAPAPERVAAKLGEGRYVELVMKFDTARERRARDTPRRGALGARRGGRASRRASVRPRATSRLRGSRSKSSSPRCPGPRSPCAL